MPTITSKSLARFFGRQFIFVFICIVAFAMFWAIGQPLKARHFITFLLYTLCFSNLVTAPTNNLRFLYAERQFPYNCLAFLIVLVLSQGTLTRARHAHSLAEGTRQRRQVSLSSRRQVVNSEVQPTCWRGICVPLSNCF